MPTELAGVSVVVVIVALVGVATSMGLDKRWAPVAAMIVGVLLMGGNQLAQVVPAFANWYNVVLWGVTAGLSAVGLYSGTKNTLLK